MGPDTRFLFALHLRIKSPYMFSRERLKVYLDLPDLSVEHIRNPIRS